MINEVLLQKRKGNVGTLIINRPEKKNSITPEILLKLYIVLNEWAKEGSIRTVIITGSGNTAFSSGYDISALPTDLSPEMSELLKKENPLDLATRSLKNFPYPIIAMINGYAFGAGVHIAMCCDIRIGSDDILIGMPPAKLGIVYFPEGLKLFVDILGMSRTREIFFTGHTYKGQEAKEMGFVNHLIPKSKLLTSTYSLAEEIAGNSPLSLKGIKKILNMLENSTKFSESNLKEAEAIIQEAFTSNDLKEGQTAFFEKRKPVFSGS